MNFFKSLLRWFGLTADRGSSDFGNFTPRAQVVLALARKEADRLQHPYVDTEHLLLGMLRLGEGVAASVLQSYGLTLESARAEVEKLNSPAASASSPGAVPYTILFKKTLEHAAQEKNTLQHVYLGTGHMLLGLLAERESIAAQALKNLGVDPVQAREKTLEKIEPACQTTRVPSLIAPLDHRLSAGTSSGIGIINFTPRAQETLGLAQEEAKRLRHHFTGSEHVLLGLLKLGRGVAVNVLRKQGADFERIRAEVEKLAFPVEYSGPTPTIPIMPPLTPAALRALSQAQQEASALDHTYVGTEHILLGLLHEETGVAAKILKDLGLQPLPIRLEILKELDPNFGT